MRDLQKLVEEVKSDMKKTGVPYNNNFSVCLRDKGSSNGMCYYDLERIDINKGLFEYGDIKGVKTTICHELIHSALGYDEKHGKLFRHYARRMGKLGYDIHTTNHYEWDRRKAYKYVLYCPNCGLQWGYKTKCDRIKNPGKYMCARCFSNLKSERGFI